MQRYKDLVLRGAKWISPGPAPVNIAGFVVTYIFYFLQYAAMIFVLWVVAVALGDLQTFQIHDQGLLFVFFFLWGNVMVSFSFMLSFPFAFSFSHKSLLGAKSHTPACAAGTPGRVIESCTPTKSAAHRCADHSEAWPALARDTSLLFASFTARCRSVRKVRVVLREGTNAAAVAKISTSVRHMRMLGWFARVAAVKILN